MKGSRLLGLSLAASDLLSGPVVLGRAGEGSTIHPSEPVAWGLHCLQEQQGWHLLRSLAQTWKQEGARQSERENCLASPPNRLTG